MKGFHIRNDHGTKIVMRGVVEYVVKEIGQIFLRAYRREQTHHASDNTDSLVAALLQQQRFLLVLAGLTLWFGNVFAFVLNFIFLQIEVVGIFRLIEVVSAFPDLVSVESVR